MKRLLLLLWPVLMSGCIRHIPDPAASLDHPANPDAAEAPGASQLSTLHITPTTHPASTGGGQ